MWAEAYLDMSMVWLLGQPLDMLSILISFDAVLPKLSRLVYRSTKSNDNGMKSGIYMGYLFLLAMHWRHYFWSLTTCTSDCSTLIDFKVIMRKWLSSTSVSTLYWNMYEACMVVTICFTLPALLDGLWYKSRGHTKWCICVCLCGLSKLLPLVELLKGENPRSLLFTLDKLSMSLICHSPLPWKQHSPTTVFWFSIN